MMTIKYNGQFSVFSEEDILIKCKQADYNDCRINAYPEVIESNGNLVQPPNFIFIDLDLGNFNNDINKLDKIKNSTLRKIGQYKSIPTIVWTGNGYHIYFPIRIPVIDHIYIFSKDNFTNLFSSKGKYGHYYISEIFMQFAENYFTGGKSDPQHRPKYKTCLIRIPGTYNSKSLRSGKSKEESQIRILQKWNGIRGEIGTVVDDFRIWLTQEEINLNRLSTNKTKFNHNKIYFNHYYIEKDVNKFSSLPKQSSKINWIEMLLNTSLEDHRKYCLWRILGPYLLNVRSLSEQVSSHVMEEWLIRCNDKRKLDFHPHNKIYNIIKGNKGFLPISYSKLKDENTELYYLLDSKKQR